MPARPVYLPGPIYLMPTETLITTLRQKARAHPHLPPNIQYVANDLLEIGGADGPPATIERGRPGKDPSLLIYRRTYLMRLYPSGRRDAYIIAAIDPLRLKDHHRLADGYLQLRTRRWIVIPELPRVPPGASAHWPQLQAEWAECQRAAGVQPEAPGPTTQQETFLGTITQLIDADEKIELDNTRSARPFAYREVRAVAEQRRTSSPMYEFVMAGEAPEAGAVLQVRGVRQQRGQVTRAAAGSVTIRFDQPLDWSQIPPQGQLEQTFTSAVFRKQREAVDLLRSGQARNPSLLSVIVDHRSAPVGPASDEPAESLDDDQLEAFRKALAVRDLMIVLGPPGTGKTRTISQIARACAFGNPYQRPPGRVLVTSHTHRAVDNVLARLPGDLLRIRVGNEDKVTAEGQPYLLEVQAAELRKEILGRTGRSLAAYADLGTAQQWAGELHRRAAALSVLAGEDAQARTRLAAVCREAGGAAQARVDAATAASRRHELTVSASANRADRLARRQAQVAPRTSWPLLGAVFRMLARRLDQQLTSERARHAQLLHDQARANAELDVAQRNLDAITRDHPAVRAAAAAVAEVVRRRDAERASVVEAAQACRMVIAQMDSPPPVSGGPPETADREIAAFQAWLGYRLPLLAARAQLLADWQGEVTGATSQLYPELIRYADVVAATCIGVASRPELSDVDFDLAIVDEAGQIGVANVLVPLVRARRAVLVGDHLQLPPYLDSDVEKWGAEVDNPVIRDLLAKSALELLVADLDPASVVMLTRQRRMPATIADFISAQFYDDRLQTAVHREHRDPLFRSPMAFVDTAQLPAGERGEISGRDRERWGQRGFINPTEAELLTSLAAYYHRQGADWAVIVPYRAQAAAITAAIAPLIGNTELAELNIGTVDSFQGGERDVILYGFTRSNPGGNVGFLVELRRANVAFTRARHQLVLVGDMGTLTMARDAKFRELARSLCAYLVEHGDMRQYAEVAGRLAATDRPAGGQ
jgi:hypothetical protein